ncbi:MAG: hypothetical protein SV487_10925 [Thermodesulfobacteriota bacterium]|nr:hypothetical protein [Thermodesulfobacteriota bacterium]
MEKVRDFIKILNNNLTHDIWGNYTMSRQLGRKAVYGYPARKSWALAKAILTKRTISFNGRYFFDTWT